MRFRLMLFPVLLLGVAVHAYAEPFTLFPNAVRLASPDGRFEVRDVDLREPGSEFSGIFHSLVLVETANGRSRKLCDYVGVAAVAWSEKDALMVTQYLNKKTSRALIFAIMNSWRLHGWKASSSIFRCGDTVSTIATAFTGIANTASRTAK
jgi:hypothetical protein